MVTIRTPTSSIPSINSHPELLILGAGWTSTFLIPLLNSESVSYVATTTTGRDSTSKFTFIYDDNTKALTPESKAQLSSLPTATTILITFPLKGPGQSKALWEAYTSSHDKKPKEEYQFIQLGSTGIFQPGDPDNSAVEEGVKWTTRHSKFDTTDPRAIAEEELIGLGGCVMNLSGLWGKERQAIHWIDRVGGTKEILAGKKSVHFIHGMDVARGILGVHRRFEKARGERWILTDLFVYDWWALVYGFACDLDIENHNSERAGKQIKWLGELMEEHGIRALPRSMQQLERCCDSREFWKMVGVWPVRARI